MRAKATLTRALEKILAKNGLELPDKHQISAPRESGFGDLASNIAMLLAKKAKKNPVEFARTISADLMGECPEIASAECAGPGFCNVTFKPEFWQSIIPVVESAGDAFGCAVPENAPKIMIEYVSANPTGPLHVGHGRGAALGDSLTRILRSQGYEVATEYYLNDAGLQMRILGQSIYLRARELVNGSADFPENCYQGEYIKDIAREILGRRENLLTIPEDDAIAICQEYGMNKILAGIKDDLRKFRCEHGCYYSEKSLVENGAVARAFEALDKAGLTYAKDGAHWFRTTDFGDDRDRVLRKSDGALTYFATDIAYHHDKFERGFERLVDVWGADHHGYIPRMRAAIEAMGKERSSFDVVLVQLVNLRRNGKPVSMSTRSGTFDTLEEVVREVGVDAARFMFLSRKSDSPLDFDLELLKERSLDNPVYYVQYAHARIRALLRRANERGIVLPSISSPDILKFLDTPEDNSLLRELSLYEEVTANAARDLSPHYISAYLCNLASLLHSYYAKHQIIVPEDEQRTLARLALSRATGQVIRNGLDLLGVAAPEQM